MNLPRLLIVEDEPIVSMDLQIRLTQLGYRVVGAAVEGKQALLLADQVRPDLVLMDIRLQGPMDGIDTAEEMRARFHLPIVFLTAYTESATWQRAKKVDPFGYLLKPFEDIDLKIAIEMALYKHATERKLQASEVKFRALIESAKDGVCVFSAQGAIVATNSAFASMHGYSKEQILAVTIEDISTPDGALMAPVTFQKILNGEALSYEVEHFCKDGRLIPLEVSANLILIDDEKFVVGFHRDITERKQAEQSLLEWSQTLENRVVERTQELQQSKTRFRQLAEATFEGIAIIEGRKLLDGNSQLGVIYGYDVSEMVSRPITDFIAPESRAWAADRARGKDSTYEFVGLRKDGSTFPVEAHARTITWHGKIMRVTAMRDLTEAKQTAAKLHAQQTELEYAQRLSLVSEISAGIIHQIGQPLCAMGANLAAALARMKACKIHGCGAFEILMDVETNMSCIRDAVTHLRAMVHPEQPQRLPHDFNHLLEATLKPLRQVAENRKIQMLVQADREVSPVTVDAVQLSQVILNLAHNAFDACAGCPADRRVVFISTRMLPGDSVELRVSDAGIGIPPENMDSLFAPFFTTKPNGIGIGLRLSRTIVEAHGGRIEACNNSDGMGATFRVVLPTNATRSLPSNGFGLSFDFDNIFSAYGSPNCPR